ncbi:sugar O-acetyltransferase [Spirochaeta africana]|uniref:Acetyltransferase n=1 Tax=Spirochaeta africana (strain ATCC 700263 / DSM 8902 / Z-7692) TaxID=889378 RepID=H9ULA4_SPIAZ|nr:sugar O-acetyltransferase [Spirochaeta africana]AFG38297.1 acetyltransferase (isoleucine patch superfamily) [Spirochaeta africana DSM 8902]
MNHKERMLAELPYKSWLDGLLEERIQAKSLIHRYNTCRPPQTRKMERILRRLLGTVGRPITIEPPFRCDYGYNIHIGDNFFANYNCIILDVAEVHIGNNVQFAPNVALYTAGHPVHAESRNSGWEFGIGITIGDDVWLGGGAIVNPGVTIGSGSVIGAGSVVTKDIPPGVIAVGNPCRVVRDITEADRNRYFKDREFSDWES